MEQFHAPPDDILITKLVAPHVPAALVTREGLLRRLDKALDQKFTLISAPAGFGKTTLVSTWIATRKPSHQVGASAWLSLDSGDNDPARFWRYMIVACQQFDPQIGKSASMLLRSPQPVALETIVTLVINDLAKLPHKHVLVVEDYHLISTAGIHASMQFLIDHLPSNLHIMLMARDTPPLPIAGLRAKNELTEITADDLRFSTQEITDFLQKTISISLSPNTLRQLEKRTEGWAVGLRLAALTLQRKSEQAEAFVSAYTGGHQHILEYLASEVFGALPEATQEFLLKTTFLNRLTASLCDTVTGRNDSQLMLQHLQQANLFLISLDSEQGWYRYHALFAEAIQHFARQRLDKTQLRQLNHRASIWYEEHQFISEAIEAALLAEEYERVAVLIETIVSILKANYEGYTIRRWINHLPEPILQAHPMLYFILAIVILFTEDRRSPLTERLLEEPLRLAESIWQATNNEERLGEIMAFRSLVNFWQNDFQRSAIAASHAMELLPEDSNEWRGICLLNLGYNQTLLGNLDTAYQTVEEAQLLYKNINIYAFLAAYFVLGNILYQQGKLLQSEQHFQYVLNTIGEDESFLDDRGQVSYGLGLIAYERDDLSTARRYALVCLEVGQQLRAEELLVWGTRLMASILHATGETREALVRLSALLPDIQTPLYRREIQSHLAELALASGDLSAVEAWHVTYVQGNPTYLIQQEQEAILQARWLSKQGKIKDALDLLNHWQHHAHTHHRFRSEMRCRILKALIYAGENDLKSAKADLIPVFERSFSEGYQRLFLDEGLPMRDLLRSLLPDVEESQRALIRALTQHFAQYETPVYQETLSPQEIRVLSLLAAGCSNPEIANELVVSVNTIKTQVKSIYRKLNITSRGEAHDVAVHLKLI